MSLDVYLEKVQPTDVFTANITHNLVPMAKAVGLYEVLWRPEDVSIEFAQELVPHLRAGLKRLQENPEFFKRSNPENGWGTYDDLVEFVAKYLHACEIHPGAKIRVSR